MALWKEKQLQVEKEELRLKESLQSLFNMRKKSSESKAAKDKELAEKVRVIHLHFFLQR